MNHSVEKHSKPAEGPRPNHFRLTIPLAIVITLIAVIYQRSTGPTYPKSFMLTTAQGPIKVKLLRSHGGESDAPIVLPNLGQSMQAQVHYKRYPTNDPWSSMALEKVGEQWVAKLPQQPPAGKLQYYITVNADGQNFSLGSEQEPVVIRFKGDVPLFILGPHVFLMFVSMLLASLAALEAFSNTLSFRRLSAMTFASLFIGGMILGPLVQKHAFGVYWAGFPFGFDLTDNKLLIGVVVWFLAAMINWKRPHRFAVMTAAFILYAIYSIPHSTMGSQLNYQSGKVETLKELKGP